MSRGLVLLSLYVDLLYARYMCVINQPTYVPYYISVLKYLYISSLFIMYICTLIVYMYAY